MNETKLNSSEKRNKKDLIVMSILEFGEIPPNTSQELLKEIYQESMQERENFKKMYESSRNGYFREIASQNQKILSKINYKGEEI